MLPVKEPRPLTTAETCKRLRCHPQTLRKMRRNGDIVGFRVGARWRYTEQAIRDFEKPKNEGPTRNDYFR